MHPAFFVTAVTLGAALLLVVAWTHLHGGTGSAATSAMLGLLGFALVGSPLWASIIVKGEGFEISVLRECEKQAEKTAELLANFQQRVPAPQAQEIAPVVQDAQQSLERLKQAPPDARAERLSQVLRKLNLATDVAARAARSAPPIP
jgi:hypothetical protein